MLRGTRAVIMPLWCCGPLLSWSGDIHTLPAMCSGVLPVKMVQAVAPASSG